MTKRTSPLSRSLLFGVAISALPVLGPPLWAQSADEDGGSYLETLLEDSLSSPGRAVEITGFSGALSSQARLESLSISDADGTWLRLEKVELDWTRSALLQGRVEVNALRADTLDWPRMPLPSDALPSPEAQPFALPELPVAINIGDLGIETARIGASVLGQDAILSLSGAMMLEGGAGQAALNVTRRDAVDGTFALTASYDNTTREASIDLNLTEAKGGLLSTALNLPDAPAVAFQITGAGPLSDFQATTSLASDGQERLRGTLTLGNDETAPDRQFFKADLGGDLAPLFAPEYRDFFGTDLRLLVNGNQEGDLLRLEQLSLNSQAMRLDGALELRSGWPRRIALDGEIASPNTARKGAATATPVRLPLGGAPTEVERVRFTLSHDVTVGPDWQLSGEVLGLRQPDLSLSTLRLSGQGRISNAPSGNQITGALDLSAAGIAPIDRALAQAIGPSLTASTRFTLTEGGPLRIDGLEMRGQDYRLLGGVAIGRDDTNRLSVQPDVHLIADDLGRFAPLSGQPLSGQASLAIKGVLQPLSDAFDLAIRGQTTDLKLGPPQLDALLAGRANLTLNSRRDATGTTLTPLRIESAAARIAVDAALRSRDSSANITVEVRDTALIAPELSGAATLSLSARQIAADDWTLTTKARAPAALTLDSDLRLTNVSRDDLHVEGRVTLATSDLAPYGKLAALPAPLAGAAALSVSGSGQPLQQLFQATAALDGQDLRIGNPIVDAILAGTATLRIDAEKTGDAPVFVRQLALTTPEVQATLSGTGDIQSAEVRYDARLRDMAVLGAGINGTLTTNGRATLRDARWQIDSLHSGPGGASLRTTGRLSQDFSDTALALTGDLPLSLANALIQPRNIRGLAQVDLRLDGAPALAALSGQITTRDARLSLPTLRQSIEAISGSVRLGGERAALDLTARPALGGRLAVKGEIGLGPNLRSDLSITLRNIVARDPSLYDTKLSGQMQLTGPLGQGGGTLGGRIDLGATELRIPANSPPKLASLPGLKHRNEPAEVRRLREWAGLVEKPSNGRSSQNALALDLEVNAPAQIFVRGRGLDAELGGALRIGGTIANVIPEGQFDLIRGRLDLLGNRLILTEGLVHLQGAFDPFIRFVAETEAEKVTAMISIEGDASAPELGFTSVPELPEDEVLSLLLFGREISTISPLQAVRLANALRTLSGQGGEGLTGGVRRELALDDLDVTTDEDGTAQARVGKYINENIYTEITADTAGNSRIDLNLQLSPSVTARGRLGSDGDTGIGLFIERDY